MGPNSNERLCSIVNKTETLQVYSETPVRRRTQRGRTKRRMIVTRHSNTEGQRLNSTWVTDALAKQSKSNCKSQNLNEKRKTGTHTQTDICNYSIAIATMINSHYVNSKKNDYRTNKQVHKYSAFTHCFFFNMYYLIFLENHFI